MNNKGFTLIEVLGVLVILTIVAFVVLNSVHSTLSVGKEESYKLMKNSILTAGYDYIEECQQGLITCDFSFEEDSRFSAGVLKEQGYFTNMESPIDGKDISQCLIMDAKKENGVVVIDLIDQCY